MQARLKAQVRRRAAFRCEYCHFPERLGELRFQLDHIRPEQHGGPTVLANLAWSCLRCNKHKGPNLSGIDPKTHRTVRLFHPRHDLWEKHFTWHGPMLLGLTPMGGPLSVSFIVTIRMRSWPARRSWPKASASPNSRLACARERRSRPPNA